MIVSLSTPTEIPMLPGSVVPESAEPTEAQYALALNRAVIRETGYSSPCHEWLGPVLNTGYGHATVAGRDCLAHRLAYAWAKGAIPPGLHIDHLCRNRLCINPEHLEAVTQAENNARSKALITHCPQGHPYVGSNLLPTKQGWRKCRACDTERQRIRRLSTRTSKVAA